MHRAEVVADQADPPLLDVVAGREQVEGGAMPLDFSPNALGIRLGVGRGARPRESALRQDRDRPVLACQAAGLLEELGAVAVRRLGVEPVEEEHAGAAPPPAGSTR